MAMVLGGIGSIALQEIGKLAIEHMPIMKQVATDTAVSVAKKSFDYVLNENPNFASFLGHFGITAFNKGNTHSTMMKRHRHRNITYHNH